MSIDQILNNVLFAKQVSEASRYKVSYEDEEMGEGVDTLLEPAENNFQVPVFQSTFQKPQTSVDTVDIEKGKTPAAGGESALVESIAGVFEEEELSDIIIGDLAEKLNEKGMETRIVGGEKVMVNGEEHTVGATLEVIAADGTKVKFKDTNGDGGIGMEDRNFANKLKELAPEKAKTIDQFERDSRTTTVAKAAKKDKKADSGNEAQAKKKEDAAKPDKKKNAKAKNEKNEAKNEKKNKSQAKKNC
jgi:hypothetical protein